MSDIAGDLLAALERGDSSLWPEGNVSANRLGWLASPGEMAAESSDLASWAKTIDQSSVVLLGMGGSSLGPAVLEAVRGTSGSGASGSGASGWGASGSGASGSGAGGSGHGGRRLFVCDTTHPVTVGSVDFSDAFVLVSSKSGTTLEPNVLFEHAWSKMADPSRYAVITDPGTPLADLARSRGVNRVFENRPDIGGRYSVLSYFGMVPGALMGYDVAELCDRALSVDRIEAVALGMTMGEAAKAGQDKVTVEVPIAFRAFGLWVEQLIAESTGKHGTGCVPVPTTEPEGGPDRHVVPVHLSRPADVAEQFMRWELAVAVCGHVLGIDPFDEPNVAESKKNTNDVLANLPMEVLEATEPKGVLPWLQEVAGVGEGDYVSLQAYLPYGNDAALDSLRRRVRDEMGGMAVTAGYGPRFLHSTGQLHKGGPNTVVAVQIVSRTPPPELPIPGKPYDFGTLIAAQAAGDHQSLLTHGRRVLRVAVDDLGEIA